MADGHELPGGGGGGGGGGGQGECYPENVSKRICAEMQSGVF